MKPSRTQLYKEQKAKLERLRAARGPAASYRVRTTGAAVGDDEVLAHSVLAEFIHTQETELAALHAPVNVSTHEAVVLLKELRSRWDAERMSQLLGDCRSSVLKGIAGPFGLGTVVAAADKVGGNVTTVHNAKQDIYARSEDEYSRDAYAGPAYKAARGKYADSKIIPNAQMVQDEYTGDLVDFSQADCDHIYSTKRYHQEGGFMQGKKQKEAFGADPDNFAMTANGANRSKQHKDFEEWQNGEASDGSGRNNKERFGHDNRRVNPAIKRGKQTAEKHAPKTGDKLAYYGNRAAVTGATEAGKMGLQQSIGLLLTEFLTASFDEIVDAYKHGMRGDVQGDTFFQALRRRLARIAKRLAAKWKDAVAAFRDGAISGFLSNLVTMLINMVVTTGKRVVRVIREGIMVILSALKMALFPPKGMTRREAGDAALKMLATGLTTSLGVMAEEVVEKAISAFFSAHLPVLAPASGPVAAVLVATMTGIASALLVYWLDRLDIFGVRREREHTAILAELDSAIADSDARINAMYEAEMHSLDPSLLKLG
jgi:hypothetical protein